MTRLVRQFTSSAGMSIADTSGPSALAELPTGAQRATVAAGCFWGVEHVYRQAFGDGKGLLDARVGYIGGSNERPTYRQVCSGKSGRKSGTEVLGLIFQEF